MDTAYLSEIGMGDFFIGRVEQILECYNNFLPEVELKSIFVTDAITESGERNYSSLFVLYNQFVGEAKNFLNTIDIDYTYIDKEIAHYWEIKSEKYDFKKASTDSRLLVNIHLTNRLVISLKATRNNCDYLMSFIKEIKNP